MAFRGHLGLGTFKDALMCQILYGSVAMKLSVLKYCHLLLGHPRCVLFCVAVHIVHCYEYMVMLMLMLMCIR